MITEDYVSFENAKLLKEKGFDVYGDGSFNSGIEIFAEYSPSGTLNKCITGKPHQKAYSAPTLQMAMKWLREVHNLHIAILWDCGAYIGKNPFYYHIDRMDNYEDKGYNKIGFDSYEEACEAAINYCLTNLI